MSLGAAVSGRPHNIEDTLSSKLPENPVVRSAKFVYEVSQRPLVHKKCYSSYVAQKTDLVKLNNEAIVKAAKYVSLARFVHQILRTTASDTYMCIRSTID